MAQQRHWGDTGQPLDKLDDVPHDKSWLKLLPKGSEVISAQGYGASYWSQSGKVDLRLENGSHQSLFIKLSCTDIGKTMVEGEYKSMRALHQVKPHFVPRPIGYGTFEGDDNTHFFLCDYVDLFDELPDMVDFCQGVAELHHDSTQFSPNGKFGFEVTTCNGTVPQYTKWHSSWETFFIETLKDAFRREKDVHDPVHGVSEEMEQLLPSIYEKVCPRLLRPLETQGRTLRPCLIHGDLWDGNTAIRVDNCNPYIFDASAIWGHNEYEFHIWRGTRYMIGRPFLEEYFKHFFPSPPEDDWDDPNLLYSLIADLHSSILFPKTEKFRLLLVQSMRELAEKFPEGYQGPSPGKDFESSEGALSAENEPSQITEREDPDDVPQAENQEAQQEKTA